MFTLAIELHAYTSTVGSRYPQVTAGSRDAECIHQQAVTLAAAADSGHAMCAKSCSHSICICLRHFISGKEDGGRSRVKAAVSRAPASTIAPWMTAATGSWHCGHGMMAIHVSSCACIQRWR